KMRKFFAILGAGRRRTLFEKTKRPARTPALSRLPVEATEAFSSEVDTAVRVKKTRQNASSVPRAGEVEAIIDAQLERMFVVIPGAKRCQHDRGHKAGAAEIVVHVLGLGRPVRGEHVFDAGADGVT